MPPETLKEVGFPVEARQFQYLVRTLRALSCGNVDPQGAAFSEIGVARSIQSGRQVEGITGGLELELEETD